MNRLLALGAAALLAGAAATPAMSAKDNFNRGSLGSKWVVTAGSLYITNDQMEGDSLSLGYDKKSASDTDVTATVYLNSTDTEYGAVASGDIASGNNAFVKIQSQNADGMFEYAGFYTGNNGGGDFFALNAPVPSPAVLSVTFCGTTATMKINSSAGTQKYQYDYGTTFGTGGGLGTYGDVSLDNYKSKPNGCMPEEGVTVITRSSNVRDLSLSK